MQATYSFGIWNNVQTSNPQTYLTSTATGTPTFAGIAGFASNKYIWDQTHVSNAVSMKSNTKGVFDFDLSASSYNYLQDILLNPFTVTPSGVGYSLNGKITRKDGTNWQNADARASGARSASMVRRRSASAFTATAIGWKIRSTSRRPGTRSPRPAPVQLFADGIGETRTGGCGCRTPGRLPRI